MNCKDHGLVEIDPDELDRYQSSYTKLLNTSKALQKKLDKLLTKYQVGFTEAILECTAPVTDCEVYLFTENDVLGLYSLGDCLDLMSV